MHPAYQRAAFMLAATNLKQMPEDTGAEVAFAGRSNAGKSSAINAICHQNALARTSRTPGRTQQLVVFKLTEQTRLVDLPGYGYAKVSAALRNAWQQHLAEYLQQRQSLVGLVLVSDIRQALTDYDQMMLDWAQASQLPVHLLLTKADKISNNQARNKLMQVRNLLQSLDNTNSVQLFSSLKKQGITEVQQVLDEWLEPATS